MVFGLSTVFGKIPFSSHKIVKNASADIHSIINTNLCK